MSVPGRIGIILIIALALIDAAILASGARDAATAIETHAVITPEPAEAATSTDSPVHPQAAHEKLVSAAIREINVWIAKKMPRPAGI
jgi:hypothetical protein